MIITTHILSGSGRTLNAAFIVMNNTPQMPALAGGGLEIAIRWIYTLLRDFTIISAFFTSFIQIADIFLTDKFNYQAILNEYLTESVPLTIYRL